MSTKKIIYMAVATSVLAASQATATEFRASTVRALGMGGSNIASTKGVNASYWNPAAYGFFGEDDASAEAKAVDNSKLSQKVWGMNLGADGGAKLFGPLDYNTGILKSLVDPSTIPTGQIAASNIGQTVADVAAFSKGVASLDPAPMGLGAFVDATTGIRVANYGINVRGALDVGGTVELDNQNIRLNVLTAVAGGTATPGAAATLANTPNGYFTAGQRSNMLNQLTSSGGLTPDEAATVIAAYEAALTTNPGGISSAAAESNLIVAATAPGDITKNKTAWAPRGALIAEVGITYGHALSERLSIGGVLKYMQAELFDQTYTILGTSGNVATSQSGLPTETSTGFGLDLGVMYRMPAWQFGLTVRNINAPSFTYTATGYTYKLDPQAKVGAAWMPSQDFTLELGYDVTKNKGAVASDESQYMNVGLEWDAWQVVALRAGAYQNLAQSDIGLVTTLGLGVNMWAIRLDIAAAVSTKDITFEGSTSPAYAMASLEVSSDF